MSSLPLFFRFLFSRISNLQLFIVSCLLVKKTLALVGRNVIFFPFCFEKYLSTRYCT